MAYWCPGCFTELKAAAACVDCAANGLEPQHSDLPAGSFLDSRYVVGRVLGRGGFGITYLGWQQLPGRRVAIKEYIPQTLAARASDNSTVVPSSRKFESEFRHGLQSFGNEASRLAVFQGQSHIVSVFELVPANGTGYMVMEYCPGPTALEYTRMYGGKLSFEDTMDIVVPVLDALTQVHARGMFHRDVSPDNILLTEQGIKLIDFGAARSALAERSVDFSAILKMAYAPPEQYSRKGRQGAWTDVYATAATMYHLMVGAPPPSAMDRLVRDDLSSPAANGVRLPAHADRAIMQALALPVDSRIPTPEAFKVGLTAGRSLGSRPAPPGPTPVPRPTSPAVPPSPKPQPIEGNAAVSADPAFIGWYFRVLANYAKFSGRARRREYWIFFLINTIVTIGLLLLDFSLGLSSIGAFGPFAFIYTLIVLLPSLAVAARRLHDLDNSAWSLLALIIPFGAIALLIFFTRRGTSGPNTYGPDPKNAAVPAGV